VRFAVVFGLALLILAVAPRLKPWNAGKEAPQRSGAEELNALMRQSGRNFHSNEANGTESTLRSPSLTAGRNNVRPLRPEDSRHQAAGENGNRGIELLQGVEATSDPVRKSEALDKAVSSVADQDLGAVLDSLKGNSGSDASEFRKMLVRRWAETNVTEAAEWVGTLQAGPEYRDGVEQVAITYANSDANAAANWAGTLPEGEIRESATLAIATEATRSDPASALAIAGELPPSSQRDGVLVDSVSQWAASDPNAATSWAEKADEPVLRQHLLAAVAVAEAERAPGPAAALVATELNPGPEQERAAVSVAQRWAQSKPDEAAAWVAQFPEKSPARAAGEENVSLIAALGKNGLSAQPH
jgi:hypothetical protein